MLRLLKYLLFALCIIIFGVTPAFSGVVTYIKEYTYQASELDSKASSRTNALELVKRQLLEELGTYLLSQTDVNNFQLSKDQITVFTAGIVSADVLQEKWDGERYYLKARILVDPLEVANSLDKIRKDYEKSMILETSNKKADEALREIEKLKKEIGVLKADGETKKKYKEATDTLAAKAWFDKGYKLYTTNNFKDSIDALTKAIEIKPDAVEAYTLRGFVYYIQGRSSSSNQDYRHSIQDFDRAIELYPNNALAFSGRGSAYSELKGYGQAITDYDKAIELDPKDATTYFFRGIAYYNDEDKQQAVRDYNQAIDLNLDPRESKVYKYRGDAYSYLKEYSQAIKDYDKAIELDSADAETFVNRGLAYDELKDYQQEVMDFKRAIKINPNNASAQYNLASCYERGDGVKQDYVEAIKHYRLAAKQGHIKAQFNLGVLYANGMGVEKDYKEAVKWYQIVAETGDAYGQAALGYMYVNGYGVPKDQIKALMYWEMASAQGNATAKASKKSLLQDMSPSDIEEAQRAAKVWLSAHGIPSNKMGEVTDTDKINTLRVDKGTLSAEYESGKSVIVGSYDKETGKLKIKNPLTGEIEDIEAVKLDLLKKSAEAGNSNSQFELAQKYLNGDGLEKNRHLAEKWLVHSILFDPKNKNPMGLIDKEFGWRCMVTDDGGCSSLINRNSIKHDGNYSWYWELFLLTAKIKKDQEPSRVVFRQYICMNCNNRTAGYKTFEVLQPDLFADRDKSLTVKDNEIEFKPLEPGASNDRLFNYVCGPSDVDKTK